MQPRIRRMRRRGDVDGLIAALGHTNLIRVGRGQTSDSGVSVRLRALTALSEIAGDEDVAQIAIGLRDRDPLVRQTTVRVVSELGPLGAADALAAAVVGPAHPDFRAARADALAVLDAIEGDTESKAKRLVRAIMAGGSEAALDDFTEEALIAAVENASQGEVDALIAKLVDQLSDLNGSLEAAQVILSWMGRRSVHALIRALGHEGECCQPAAEVLGAIRDSEALEPLTEILEDRRADVRRAAVWALGELRDPRTAEQLMKATMDDEYVVRKQAGEALDAMGSVALMAGVANMIRSLERRSDGPEIARLVEEGLERTPPSVRVRGAGVKSGWTPRFIDRLLLGTRPPEAQ